MSTTPVHCASWENGREVYGRKKDFQFNSQAKTFVPHSNQTAQVTNVSSVDDNQGMDPDQEQNTMDLGDEMSLTKWQWSTQNNEVIGDLILDQSPEDGNGNLIPETIDNVCIPQGAHPREINHFLGYSWEEETKFKCSRKAAEAMAGELLERDSAPLTSEVLQMLNLWKFKSNPYRKKCNAIQLEVCLQ